MTNAAFTITPVPEFRTSAIADGYVYECSCGELYNDVGAAYSCRKCRNYCVFGWCTHVVDIRTGEVVAGEEPSEAEYKEACARAEAKWEEERAEMEFNRQMWAQQGELYEAEIERRQQEAMRKAAEQHIDQLYLIQDKLSGIA